jgi:hypothetical protein
MFPRVSPVNLIIRRMRSAFLKFALLFFCALPLSVAAQDYSASALRLLNAVKRDDAEQAALEIQLLANAREETLAAQLGNTSKAKAFWLNVYNAFVQYQLKNNPDLFHDRDEFFSARTITIAATPLSLDDIEHGIIRRSTHKYSFGYFGSVFTSDFEKQFRLDRIDYRIHFALNCGAKSCPPVAFYEPQRVEAQLEIATKNYLRKFVSYDAGRNLVQVPVLCSWYRGDFGGETGIIAMLKKYGLVGASKLPKVEYLPYDWTLHLSHYILL